MGLGKETGGGGDQSWPVWQQGGGGEVGTAFPKSPAGTGKSEAAWHNTAFERTLLPAPRPFQSRKTREHECQQSGREAA